jgi:Asp-tRNA(Asn)/Glu-tRNA(Gln) amidotransferase A subunit family amidase
LGSLGTDTGGSIRIPASYCGVVGLKPTYGRVSNRGVIPNSWTFDTVGPMCKTVEDAALVLGAIAGYDELDPSSVDRPVPDYRRAIGRRVSRLRLGVPRSPFFEELEPEVGEALEAALVVLRELAGDVTDVEVPPSPGPSSGPSSFYGLPAISLPCGFTSSGLPIGLQISGAPFAESTVLALAHAYEQATEWHKKRPTAFL